MILEISIVSLLADLLDLTMLLPLINPQNTCQSDGNPHDLLEGSEGLRVPLRVCHSIPDSSFTQKSSSPIPERPSISRSDSKKVRFATYGESVQYFDPTERSLCVERSMFSACSQCATLTMQWTT
jgi:hypothetical protein